MDISRPEMRFFLHVTTSCLLLSLMIGIAGVATNAQQPRRVVTEPSVNTQRGKAGLLPCFFEFKPIAVLWNKGSSAPEDMIVRIDTYYNPGQKDGPGYLEGTFDIATNFSLLVKEVKLEDFGRYFCVVVSFETRSPPSNHTDLTVFVPPAEPFPTITECYTSTTERHTEQNCILDTREDSMNVTCIVNGYFPTFRLLFSHYHFDIEVLKTLEWNNTDGTYGRSMTIRAVPNPEPYICIASGIVRSGDVDESSTNIILKKEILEPLALEHKRSKEIGIIIALLLVSVIIPLVSFLFIVRKTKLRTRDLKVQSTSSSHYQQAGPLSMEEENRCRRDLRYQYKQCLTQIRTSPLELKSLINLGDISTNLFLMKDFVPNQNHEDYGNSRFMKKESITHKDFLRLISRGGPSCRILLIGETGVGKTTFLAKMVKNWSDEKGLENIKLMFYVPLSEAVKCKTFDEAIRMYRLPNVNEYVRRNQETAMILFDDLDEFGEDITVEDPHNAIVQILRGERYKDSIVVLTTRPWKAVQILSNTKLRKLFTCIGVEGFNIENANEYVMKFFKGEQSLAHSLISFLEKDTKERGVFSNEMISCPIYLAMFCHMWRDVSKQTKIRKLQTVSQLMEEMINTLKEHYASKAGQTEPKEDDYSLRLERVERCFKVMGRIAYQGCLSNRLIINEEFRVQYKNSIETAYKVGVLTRERGIAPREVRQIERRKYADECRFPHRLFQDYLAAVHLATLYDTDKAVFNRVLQVLLKRSHNNLDTFKYIWYFLASRSTVMAKTTLEFLVGLTYINKGDFVIRVAFECQEKDAVVPSAILKERILRLSNEKSLAAYIHFLATSSTVDTLILEILPENKTLARYAAKVIFSLENLRTLVIDRCVHCTAEMFYEEMAKVSQSSKIEALVHFCDELTSLSSQNYAKSVFSMPRLRVLDIQFVNLEDIFYRTMARLGHKTWIEKLRVMFEKKQSSDAARDIATGISSLPHLSSLYLSNVDDILLNEICVFMTTSSFSFKISTVILEDAVLTRWNMETLLSLDSLRSIRFISVKARKEDEMDLGSHGSPLKQDDTIGSSQVKELSMDDESLPYLIELDVHNHCSQVQKVQLDFKSDVNNDIIMKLNKFSSASQLYFVGYWSYEVQLYKTIEVKDTTSLSNSLMTSWRRLVCLVIADIMMGNSKAQNILWMVREHDSLKNIMLTRCGTTDALIVNLEEMKKNDVLVTTEHGDPVTRRTFKEMYEDNLQRSFEVITVDKEP